MPLNHGINTYKSDTGSAAVRTALVGIPFFVGAWPCHTAGGTAGQLHLAHSFEEARGLGGYSAHWRTADGKPTWNLCQAMYAHFKLFGMSPAVFCNVFDPAKHKEAKDAAEFPVADHTTTLPMEVICDEALVVKSGDATLVKDTDYEVFYDAEHCVIELTKDGSAYDATALTVSYNAAKPEAITAADVEAAVERIEECKTRFGLVPDLICAPGWSRIPTVAAVMAAKAPAVSGLFKAKAVVDIDTDATTGASDYAKVLEWKNKNGYTDKNMIVCWPLAKVGEYIFDYSVIACGVMARVDADNGGCPYESPSNKSIPITGLCVKDGTEVNLSIQQADTVSYAAGVVTALNFDGWVLWGNYTGCWPASSDVSDYFICTNRMMDYVCNTFVNTYWSSLDRPLKRVHIDAIVNSFNAWLAGLTHDGKLYGGQIRYEAASNPTANLLAGKFRLDTHMASPVPAQQIDMHVEFDVEQLTAALNV